MYITELGYSQHFLIILMQIKKFTSIVRRKVDFYTYSAFTDKGKKAIKFKEAYSGIIYQQISKKSGHFLILKIKLRVTYYIH